MPQDIRDFYDIRDAQMEQFARDILDSWLKRTKMVEKLNEYAMRKLTQDLADALVDSWNAETSRLHSRFRRLVKNLENERRDEIRSKGMIGEVRLALEDEDR